MDDKLGTILRKYRKQRNITLQELADKTGLSTAYISLLERNITSPTLKNLNAICQALNTTMARLISELEASDDAMVKNDERDIITKSEGYTYELATKVKDGMKCVVMTVLDNELHVSNPHIVDEIGFIISGTLKLTLMGTEYDMMSGDCIYIRANQPHQYVKTSEEPCVSVWVYDAVSANIYPPVTRQ